VFPPDTPDSVAQLTDAIRGNPYLRRGYIVVEEYLESATVQSPSLELFVPAAGHGEPIITYLSDQLFLDDVGSTCGVFISRDLMETAWYPALAGAGLTIARNLQRMGYVGHFDLDTILSDDGRIFLLEVNARRTAGTHAHEFGEYSLGPNYLDEHVVLCLNKMASGAIRDVEALESAIGELAWPARGTNAGVVIAATSGLAAGEFGCILIAPTRDEVVGLLHVIAERLGGGATPARGLAMNLNGA
ncbi:MAG: hypothetical protein ACE5FI_16790, partial [Anaerolineales bacterium]